MIPADELDLRYGPGREIRTPPGRAGRLWLMRRLRWPSEAMTSSTRSAGRSCVRRSACSVRSAPSATGPRAAAEVRAATGAVVARPASVPSASGGSTRAIGPGSRSPGGTRSASSTPPRPRSRFPARRAEAVGTSALRPVRRGASAGSSRRPSRLLAASVAAELERTIRRPPASSAAGFPTTGRPSKPWSSASTRRSGEEALHPLGEPPRDLHVALLRAATTGVTDELSHVDEATNHMVDVGSPPARRRAVARAFRAHAPRRRDASRALQARCREREGRRTSAAKRTSELIPSAIPRRSATWTSGSRSARAESRSRQARRQPRRPASSEADGRTAAALTVYDMAKAIEQEGAGCSAAGEDEGGRSEGWWS